MTIGHYGKHPAFGDFISAGLSDATRSMLEIWLNKVLPQIRADWAEAWEATYDSAPSIRFWIGERLTGAGAFCGSFFANRDKVGRRFPLMIGVEGSDCPPPVIDPDQRIYEAIEAHVSGFTRQADMGAAGLNAGMGAQIAPLVGPQIEALPGSFWATRPGIDVAQLWTDVAAADHARAATGRSYFWATGPANGMSALLVGSAMPDAGALGWLMSAATLPQVDEEEAAGSEDVPTPDATRTISSTSENAGDISATGSE
jgi:type VI secretion system protein ImpM